MGNFIHRIALIHKDDIDSIKRIESKLNELDYVYNTGMVIENHKSPMYSTTRDLSYMILFPELCNENYCDYFDLNQFNFKYPDYRIGFYLSLYQDVKRSKVFPKTVNKLFIDLFKDIQDEKIIFLSLLEVSKYMSIFKDKFIEKQFKSKQL
jgi:hypothetical protein